MSDGSTSRTEQFQHWLAHMDTALDGFFAVLPRELASGLDYSLASLTALELYYLELIPSIDEARRADNAGVIDGFARYVGETIRRAAGGKWFISFTDEKNAFYGLPQLGGTPAFRTQCCPLTLVTAAADRRSGKFWSTVASNIAGHV